jgi:HEPN/RES N-terminal domain 1/RES domain
MGQYKQYLLECEGRGYYSKDTYVCSKCVADKFLADVVKQNLISDKCYYCNKKSKKDIAASFDIVIENIWEAISNYYRDAQDIDLPWADGSRIQEDYYTNDIIDDFDPGWPEKFREDICNSLTGNNWVSCSQGRWYEVDKATSLRHDWKNFCNHVVYKTRYLFLSEPHEEDMFEYEQTIPVRSFLDELGKIINKCKMIKCLDQDIKFYRVRENKNGVIYSEFDELGVPPFSKATSGRMNPAGIPYFYLASNHQTAKAETIAEENKGYCLATFTLKKRVKLLDLTKLPPAPSIFNHNEYNTLCYLHFIESFVKDVIKPIEKDGKEHIDYVPTQIVSEYFRHRFRGEDNSCINGIIYPSSRHTNGCNFAFFMSDNKDLKETFDLKSVQNFNNTQP